MRRGSSARKWRRKSLKRLNPRPKTTRRRAFSEEAFTAQAATPADGSDPAEEAALAAEAAPPPPATEANLLLPPNARRQPGPTAFTGFVRCAGQVTYFH